VAYDLGEYESAKRYFEQGLAIRKEVGHPWSIAVSLGHLGDVALAQGNGERARRWYQESLEVGRGGAPLGQVAEALTGLGEVSSAEGDFEQARQHFRDTMELGMAGRVVYIPMMLKVLVAVAQLAARMGEKEKPAEWLAYVAEHAASTVQTRDKAKGLLEELAPQLSLESMDLARERSEDMTLDEVVQEILQVLGP
jgi:tetratricopeptide (TPR) repeat protein